MNETLGQRIKGLRISKGMTQTELASGAVTPSMISQIEADKAKPSFRLVEAIASKLDVPVDELMEGMDEILEKGTNMKLMKSLISSGEFSKAISLIERMLQEDREAPLVLELIELYLKTGMPEKAEMEIKQEMLSESKAAEKSHRINLIRLLGETKLLKKDFVMANHFFEKATKDEEHSLLSEEQQGYLYENLGESFFHLGRIDDACQNLRKAIVIFQNAQQFDPYGKCLFELGTILQNTGDEKGALECFQDSASIFRSLKEKEEELKAKLHYASVLRETRREDEAIEYLFACEDEMRENGLEKNIPFLYSEVSSAYFQKGELDEAEKWCRKSLFHNSSVNIQKAFSQLLLGKILSTIGREEDAVQSMRESVQLSLKLSEYEKAYESLQELTSLLKSLNRLEEAANAMGELGFLLEKLSKQKGVYI